MIVVLVDSLRVNQETDERVVCLKEVNGSRQLPVWIGKFYADALVEGMESGFPEQLKHWSFLEQFMTVFNIAPLRAIVGGVPAEDHAPFLGWFEVRQVSVWPWKRRRQRLAMPPADAMLLALFHRVPIHVEEETMRVLGRTDVDTPETV